MKKLRTIIAALLISATATFAQAPQGFSYQAVVRDAQNAIVANQIVEVTLTILQGATADAATAVFTEKHNAKTNANGLFTLIIGSIESEKFAAINWATGNVFLKTETDYGTSVTQMLSVPFALYAAKAADADIDLSAYALKSEIPSIPTVPTKVSAFENDANYLTAHQDLSAYALKSELPTDANLSGYYSKAEVDALLANISNSMGDNTVSVTAGDNGTVKGASGKFYSGQSLTYTAVPNSGYYFSRWSDYNNDNPRTIIIYSDINIAAQFAQNPLVTVTAGSNGSVGGSTNGRYAPGSSLSFTATPSDGYYFNQWSDGYTTNPRYISVYTSDITLEAEFVQNPLVTISAGSNGAVNTIVNGRYAPGSNVTITATPNSGYYFSQWSDGNTDNPRTITIDKSNVTLSAEFVAATIATVDLGLTSGNLWATCNVGAINPWNYGNYYAWGETETKTNYDISTYKYCNGGYNSLTKYCNDASYGFGGFTDALTTLESIDDAATAVFGSDYSMPTLADWNELSGQCYWVWTTNYNEQNVSGYIVYRAKSDSDKGVRVYGGGTPSASYSLSDAHVFLPAAGFRYGTDLGQAGAYGYYRSASLYGYDPDNASYCNFGSSGVYPSKYISRCYGYSVRPVRRTN
ncbi:MAG: hypothetical protein J5651_03170 [Salinivirgaceae bacterium]|nr:hypothetical protein [Salinivirgaceae bacterium]